MSIVNLFTKKAPNIAGYSFDAVLEDSLEMSVELTDYPIENGVRVNDHRIYQPVRWYMTGAVSNNPLSVQITDVLGGALSNLTDNPWVAAVAGLSAGWLAGGDDTRSSSTLQLLIELMNVGDPFNVDAGDINLKNMVITRLSRAKDPTNENGLIFVAEMQELITLDRVGSMGLPSPEQLRDGDPAKSAISRTIDRGLQFGKEVNDNVRKQVNTVLDGIF